MLTHANRRPIGMLQERDSFAEVVEDAAEAAIVGAGHEHYAIDTGQNGRVMTLAIVVEVPWWRRLWFDAEALELRVQRMLLLLATPHGWPFEYQVRVRVGRVRD